MAIVLELLHGRLIRTERSRGKLVAYGADNRKDLRGDPPGCEHDGVRAVL